MPTRIVETDVTDWDDDFEAKEPDVMTNEQIIERRMEGMHSAEAGRLAYIAHLRGLTEGDFLPASKYLIQLALVGEINKKTSKKKRVELANGKSVDIREYVAPVENENDDEAQEENVAIVDSGSEQGVKEAVAYLLKRVPGYIYGRLAIIAKSGNEGDVEKYADELKDIIDDIVVKLG